MGIFVETSGFLSFLFNESEGAEIGRALTASDELYCSRLLITEARRAIFFHTVQKRLSASQAAEARTALQDYVDAFETIPISEEIHALAEELWPGSPLRTLDAIHLATYHFCYQRDPSLHLLALDKRVREAAKQNGYPLAIG